MFLIKLSRPYWIWADLVEVGLVFSIQKRYILKPRLYHDSFQNAEVISNVFNGVSLVNDVHIGVICLQTRQTPFKNLVSFQLEPFDFNVSAAHKRLLIYSLLWFSRTSWFYIAKNLMVINKSALSLHSSKHSFVEVTGGFRGCFHDFCGKLRILHHPREETLLTTLRFIPTCDHWWVLMRTMR